MSSGPPFPCGHFLAYQYLVDYFNPFSSRCKDLFEKNQKNFQNSAHRGADQAQELP